MAQARRRGAVGFRAQKSGSFAGIALLLAGLVIGSLGTILWQGSKTEDGFGAGIRRALERVEPSPTVATNPPPEAPNATPTKPYVYRFYDVLEDIEVAVPSAPKDPPATPPTPSTSGAYLLQAGSYTRRADADRLKATLALNGLVSSIQKVTIEGRGEYYRVRLGPYRTYQSMEEADAQLIRVGIKALRLKLIEAG